ncbi:MAG: hypothetical protein GX108_03015 [Thermovirga sp.]|nr:hypothetical protein [Thermovirga sp.]
MITFEEYRDAFKEWERSNFSEPFKYSARVYPGMAVKFMQTEFAKPKYMKRCKFIASFATICLLGSIPAFIWINWIAGLGCLLGCFILNKITSSCAEKLVAKQIVEDSNAFYLVQEFGVVEISRIE